MTAGHKNKKQTTRTTTKRRHKSAEDRLLPFIEHVRELRRRVFYIVLSIAVFSIAAYTIEHQLINFLLKPSGGQQFIYTSPVGGLNFLFKVCIYVGIAASLPVIVYQFLRYVEPLLKRTSTRFIYLGTVASGVLALVGMAFGYFIGLPAALHFLLHQFHTAQIHPLLTIDEYMSFVTLYMFGSALMFQVPLIVLFINRIKPLTPQKLLHYEKWVLVLSFVLAFIMDPTPNVVDQVFIALPIVLSYQLSIAVIWWQRSHSRRTKVTNLREMDATAQAERLERASHLRPLLTTAPLPAPETPTVSTPAVSVPATPSLASRISRPSRSYASPVFTRAYSLPRRPYIDL